MLKYFFPGRLWVVVGDESKFDEALSKFGKVQAIDYRQISEAERTERVVTWAAISGNCFAPRHCACSQDCPSTATRFLPRTEHPRFG